MVRYGNSSPLFTDVDRTRFEFVEGGYTYKVDYHQHVVPANVSNDIVPCVQSQCNEDTSNRDLEPHDSIQDACKIGWLCHGCCLMIMDVDV